MHNNASRTGTVVKFACVLLVQLSSVVNSPSSQRNRGQQDPVNTESPFSDILIIYLN